MPLSMLIAATVGLLLGFLLAWLLATRTHRSALNDAERRVADASARLDERTRAFEARERDAESRLRETFQALSADALRQNNQSFLDLAKTSFGELHTRATGDLDARQRTITEMVTPIRDALEKLDGKLQQDEVNRTGMHTMLLEHVRLMGETQKELATRTKTLVDALKSPHVRGRWGEIQLKRVCEMAGMLDHCDFVEQSSVDSADGRLRPDLMVKLPGGKLIIVDAKAPLQGYLDAIESHDDATREARLRDHSRQVRDHITKLSAKSYWGQFEQTPELVVMFLPGETFFSAALQYDPSLIEYGVEQRVIPASPTTLIGLLRAVHYGWKQERIAQNAEEISAAGRELYERIRTFASHMSAVKQGIERAAEGYNNAIGSLQHRVLPQARRFRTLGATSAAELDEVTGIEVVMRTLDAGDIPLAAGNGDAALAPAPADGDSPS